MMTSGLSVPYHYLRLLREGKAVVVMIDHEDLQCALHAGIMWHFIAFPGAKAYAAVCTSDAICGGSPI
jgi:hypothetical protein